MTIKKNTTKIKLFLVTFGLLAGLLIAELGTRVYKYLVFNNLDDIEFDNRAPIDRPEEELTLGQIIQISSHEKIVYELVPDSRYRFQNALVETNSKGFRDKEYPELKKTGTKRIIGIGDSSMFGWGVDEEDTYLSRLEEQLNQMGSQRYEVINTAVPGYNTVMEVEVLEKKTRLDQIDLVIINFIGNDFDLPSFIRERPNFLTLKKSFVLMLLEDLFIDSHKNYVKWLGVPPVGPAIAIDDVPEEHRDLIGPEHYVKAMKRLSELSKEHDFGVIVFSQSPFTILPEVVTTTCAELGFTLIDFAPYWQEIKATNPNLRWKISETDWHPNQVGHRELAKVLFEKVHAYFTP